MAEVNSKARGVIEVKDLIKDNKMMDATVINVLSIGMYRLIVTRSKMTLRMGKCSKIASSSKINEDNERLFVMQHVLN